jgi:transcriptional regulator with XRE-family HTH domain
MNKKPFSPAKVRTDLTSGGMLKFLREMKGWTQQQLAEKAGISITNISALEHDRQELGKKRAELFAKAFKVHPVTIMYPEFQSMVQKAA